MPDAHAVAAPDADVELMVPNVSGQWGAHRLGGPARVRLTSDAILIDAPQGSSMRAPLADLTGAGWRAGTLSLHGPGGSVAIETKARGETIWTALIQRACPVPEFARSHRRLGSRRGGAMEAQVRFFTPFIQVRRDLNAESDLDRRVAAVRPRVLAERLRDVLEKLADEAHPESAPDRRGLLAELNEAVAPVLERIDVVDAVARRFAAVDESERFTAWRAWIAAVSDVFAAADRAWYVVARLLPVGEQP